MQFALSGSPQMSMANPIDRDEHTSTVQTRVWIDEHDWLHRIFKSPDNTSPKFRFPDLLSACVSLVLASDEGQRRLVEYLVTRLTLRNPRTERRSCDIWSAQFDQLMQAHRAPWNRFPNPMFELDHLSTACVAVAMSRPDGEAVVLRQARMNLLARTRASGLPVN
jgi:hypothetical protein